MNWPSRRAVRAVAAVVLLLTVALLAHSAVLVATGQRGDGGALYSVDVESKVNQSDVDTQPIPPNSELTVVATQGFFVSDETADLFAVTRNGTVVYHNSTYKVYFDVDPVPGTEYTVEYAASRQISDCEQFVTEWCTRNVFERVNLSTGEVERIYSELTPRVHATRWHDVDRINDTHVVIAGIYSDSVYTVDLRDDEVEWRWEADSLYSRSVGGPSGDWTHINDVELLDDGRIMVSVRNMDEVVFLDPGSGAETNWTLGEDENHSILYEQHNPDFIPAANGGPSVIVADSENHRVVEYNRGADGDWDRTWRWRDARMTWPRDADRLPNGNTLVADSHGDRVLEIAPNGTIVWQAEAGMPYDVERLGTGDESSGGPAIGQVEGTVDAGVQEGPIGRLLVFVKDQLPSKAVNSALFIGPAAMRFTDLIVGALLLVDLLVWSLLEYWWAGWSVTGLARSAWHRAADRS